MAVEITDTEETGNQTYERDPRWLLAKRIARSSAFARSERLPKLLLYICRLYLSERSQELNELQIGIAVFRRSPNYDPATDSIVRSHATRLRQRLDLYFNTEGARETLRLEIPRGGYLPRFYEAVELPQPLDDSSRSSGVLPAASDFPLLEEGPPQTLTPEAPPERRGWALPFCCGLLLALLVAFIVWHLHQDAALQHSQEQQTSQSAVERGFWQSLFQATRRTLCVTGDSGLVLYETFTGGEVPLSEYAGGNYLQAPVGKAEAKLPTDILKNLGSRRYTSIADLQLITKLSHLPQWSSNGAEIIFARDLRSDQVEKSNLILVGSRQANPWVGLYEPSMNFLLRRDAKGEFYFLNRAPQQGEKEHYSPSADEEGSGGASVYGLVAYLPSASGQGKVLILSGLWMSGTESAGNFVLNDQQFSTFLSSIARKDGNIPPFELLIRTKVFGGNAIAAKVIAKRVHA